MFIKEFKPVQKTDEYKWKNGSYSPSVDPLLDQRLDLDFYILWLIKMLQHLFRVN